MLKVKDLCINYEDTKVVEGLSFELESDEILMLVGPTGCGKTSVLKAIAGLVPIAGGEICFSDWKVDTKNYIPPEKRNLGMVFQDFALFPHLTVEENIGFRLSDSTQVDHWIKVLGLEKHRTAKPGTLSGGQKQRVALARTLAHQPAFILLDEPLSNLDAAMKDELRWEIRQSLKNAGIPAIWVTHDQEEALSVGDRIGILKEGKLEQIDTPEKCYLKPINRFVARFLGEVSLLPGVLENGGYKSSTSLGQVNISHKNPIDKDVDIEILLRPDDVKLKTEQDTNGRVVWCRYEGSARLYSVELDCGTIVKVRCRHEKQFEADERVKVLIETTHPLAAFPK